MPDDAANGGYTVAKVDALNHGCASLPQHRPIDTSQCSGTRRAVWVGMLKWNVIVTVHGDGYTRAAQILRRMGTVNDTRFYNVLAMQVDDISEFMDRLAKRMQDAPDTARLISRVAPATHTFDFDSAQSFEERASVVALGWVTTLANKSFHVRFHRRGFKHQLHSQEEERFLDHILLDALAAAGTPGHITFDEPDAILTVETLGDRAGMSLWMRDELERYAFLKVD
jgi:tRNA(Ser,Leu) C12 N-acetylase TAN1